METLFKHQFVQTIELKCSERATVICRERERRRATARGADRERENKEEVGMGWHCAS